MKQSVTVVDYGVGNLLSISRAIARLGARVSVTSNPDSIANADRLILPGVGAFGHCAENLRAANLAEPVVAFVRSGRPFLGICVGMQLLFDYSSEFGKNEGLGLIPGTVGPIPRQEIGAACKVPHIGWSTLQLPPARDNWLSTPLEPLTPGQSSVYFVHSYNCSPHDVADLLATVDYQNFDICAAVSRNNICGVQFHPEKSGAVGLAFLAAFIGDS